MKKILLTIILLVGIASYGLSSELLRDSGADVERKWTNDAITCRAYLADRNRLYVITYDDKVNEVRYAAALMSKDAVVLQTQTFDETYTLRKTAIPEFLKTKGMKYKKLTYEQVLLEELKEKDAKVYKGELLRILNLPKYAEKGKPYALGSSEYTGNSFSKTYRYSQEVVLKDPKTGQKTTETIIMRFKDVNGETIPLNNDQ